MVDDLIDIGAEALQLGIEAAAISNINSDTETPELKKKKKQGFISAIIMGILVLGLFYILMIRWDSFGSSTMIIDEIGLLVLIGAIILSVFIVFIIGFFAYLKKRNKEIKKIYVLIGLSGICTAAMIYFVSSDLNFTNLLQYIPLIGFTFGIILLFFMLFNKIGHIKVNQLLNLPLHLLIHFCIPMMFVCILVLGAMQGYNNYESVFLEEAYNSLYTYFGDIMGEALYGIVEVIFNMGSARPVFFLFVSVAITLFLLYETIRRAIWKERWPYTVYQEDGREAQHFIDSADDKFLSKEDLESFKRGKLRLQKKYLDEYKEAKHES